MKTALLIVDVQNDYFPNGKMELDGSHQASDRIGDVLSMFRDKHSLVVYIKHISKKASASFFLPNTKGVEIFKDIQPEKDEKIIEKNYPNSFRETELHKYLMGKKVEKLVIVGMMTHMCIDATVRAAYDLGYKSVVISDCCATKALKINNTIIDSFNVQNAFLAAIDGTFAEVISCSDFIKTL